jgi:hypothetical protein
VIITSAAKRVSPGGVGRGCLSEGLEEGDLGGFIGFDDFEEGLGVHYWEY